MGTAQPIRNREALRDFLEYYRSVEPSARNYALVILGVHTALRISDILPLRWRDLYDHETRRYREHLDLYEKKTGKHSRIALNAHVIRALGQYRAERNDALPDDFVFTKSTCYQAPLCRSQAYRIVRRAAEQTVRDTPVSCHSLRKTFGYYAWKQGTPPALLMDIYNHSSYQITKRYLGIEQDERDSVFLKLDFEKNEFWG